MSLSADFDDAFSVLFRDAFETGIRSIPPSGTPESPYPDAKQFRRFIAACHRGYDKAQNRAVDLLEKNSEDEKSDDDQRRLIELSIRKVIDGMAYTMLQARTYVMRRLCFHDQAPALSLNVIRDELGEANCMNRENRQTFAVVADLTTFIHVADLLKVDFSSPSVLVSLIELKSGKVNNMLLEQLEKYRPTPESIKALEQDPLIAKDHIKQAKRMLRQRIRIAQIDEILTTDTGTDLASGARVRLTKNVVEEPTYDSFLEELCAEAAAKGYASGTVDHCIHLGVGHADDIGQAKERAHRALEYAVGEHFRQPPQGLVQIENEIRAQIPSEALLVSMDLFLSNLNAVPCRPFVLWHLKREHILELAARRLCILLTFDVVSFVYSVRKAGVEIAISSRKRAAETAQTSGASNVPTWGGRGLVYKNSRGEEILIMSGMLSRFVNDLVAPMRFMKQAQAEFGPD